MHISLQSRCGLELTILEVRIVTIKNLGYKVIFFFFKINLKYLGMVAHTSNLSTYSALNLVVLNTY